MRPRSRSGAMTRDEVVVGLGVVGVGGEVEPYFGRVPLKLVSCTSAAAVDGCEVVMADGKLVCADPDTALIDVERGYLSDSPSE